MKKIIITAALALCLPAIAVYAKNGADDGVKGHKNGHGHSKNSNSGKFSDSEDYRTQFNLKYEATADATQGVSGWAKFKDRGHRGRITTRFTSKVVVPIPSLNPQVADFAAAENLVLEAMLLHSDGLPYALCEFEFDRDDYEDANLDLVTRAHYKIDLRIRARNGVIKIENNKGFCDTDLNTDGIQTGIPAMEGTDSVAVYSFGDLLLTGTF